MQEFQISILLLLLCVLSCFHGYRILKSGATIPDGAYFRPFSKGNASRYGDPALYKRERINEGALPSGDQELIYEGVTPRQTCPGMVGPFSDGNYYCSAKEFGYCDRRSGTCFCNMGYSGNDCLDCSDSHFKIGYHCFPKKLCPNDCNGAGICNYNNGSCTCFPHREGSQCEILLCSTHSPLCEACTKETCLACKAGYYLSFDSQVCRTCYDFDPRCAGCTKDQGCTVCADSTLTSVLRSGYRTSDPPLPIEEDSREFSITLPFGTKSPESFADAENYFVATTPDKPLKSQSISCDQGLKDDETWSCNSYPESHVVCGHFGIFSFRYPNYAVTEKTKDIRMYVRRSGGGYGHVRINYFIKHFTTNDSDLIATAAYTTSQQLDFYPGVIERSFKITIIDDNIVEEDEVFQVVLEVPEGGGSVGAQFRANVTIIDDDLPLVNNKLSKVLQNTTQAKAGEPFTIFVKAVAASGIPFTMGGNIFYSLIENDINIWTNPKTPTNGQRNALRQVCSVSDLGNGTYAITSTGLKEQGNYQLRVWVGFPNAIKGQYYYDAFFERLAVQRLDHMVNFTWGTGRLIPRGSDYISIRWSGLILSKGAGLYKFKVEADDNARLWIDNDLLLDHWHEQFASLEPSRQVYFTANSYHELVLEYREARGEAHARLLWSQGGSAMQVVPQENLVSLFEVDRSPVQVKILSTETSAAKTECTGDGLYRAVARHRSYFTICPRDEYRNLRTDDSLFYLSTQLFDSNLTIVNPNHHKGVGAEVITPTLNYNFDTYCFDGYYTPELAGTYMLNIFYRPWRDDQSQHVAGSPFRVIVDPDKMSGPHSDVNGLPNPLYAEAGKCYDFTVVARDNSKNLIYYGGSSITLYAYRVNQFYETPKSLPPFPGNPSAVPTTVPTGPLIDFGFQPNYKSDVYSHLDIVRNGIMTDLKNGNYSMRICPVISGLYEIHIILSGSGVSNQHFNILNAANSIKQPSGYGTFTGDYVSNSPYAMVVTHTIASAVTSTASGPGLSTAITGIPTYFVVTVRDPWDNILRDKTYSAVVTAKLDLSPSSFVYVSDYKNGSFYVQYVPQLSGNNWLSVYVNGYQIRASPFVVNVSSSFTGSTGITGKASAQFSYVTGSGLHSGETGYESYFLLYSYDIYANKIGSYDDYFSFEVKGANFFYNATVEACPNPPISDHPICDPYDNRGGIYFGTFIPLVAELVHIRVYLLNLESHTQTELAKSNFSALIIPSEPKAENSDISGALYDNVAGVTKNVNLHLRDYYENKLDLGGDSLELALLGVSEKWGTEEPFYPEDGLPNQYYYTGFNKGNPTTYGLVTDNKDGSYIISYSSNITGLYVMRIALAEHGLNATFFNDTSFGYLHDNNYNSPSFSKSREGVNSNLGNDISWTGDINGVPGPRGDLGRSSYIGKYLSVVEKNVAINFTHSTPDVYLNNRKNNRYKFRDEYWSVRYTGMITPPFAEVYSFSVDIDTESSVELRIGGVGNEFNGSVPGDLVIYFNSSHQIPFGVYNFSDNKYREFVLSYSHPTGDAVLVLYWESYSTPKTVVPYAAFHHWRNISEFNTTIHPAPLSSKDSTAYGDALYNAQVSVIKSFIVYARDQFGNLLQTGGHNPTMFAIGKNGVAFRGRVTDYGNSTYLIEYYPTVAGDYLIYVTIGCCPQDPDVGYQAEIAMNSPLFIKGSPFVLKVIPAEIDQTRTIAVGNGLTGGIVGEISSFTIIFRDIHNNPTTVNKSDNINISVRFYDQKSHDSLIPIFSKFIYLPNNVTYYYNITKSGYYNMHVDISVPFITTQIVNNNILQTSSPYISPIVASPFSVIINPKIFPDPSKTVCKGVGLRQASVNKIAIFEVKLFDIYNNPLLVGGNKFYIRFVGDAKFDMLNQPVIPLCSDNQNGVYSCSYTPRYKGSHHIEISLLQRTGNGVGGSGLLGSYYTSLYGSLRNTSFPEVVRVDSIIDMKWIDGYIIPNNISANGGLLLRDAGQSIRWDGYLVSPRSDFFNISAIVTNLNVSIYCDNKLVFDSFLNIQIPVIFVQNSVYQIRIETNTNIQIDNLVSINLMWSTGIIKAYTIPSFFLYPYAQNINLSPFPVQVNE